MVPYYKERVLKDGIHVILRPLVKEDRDKLLDFFHRIDDADLSFLRSNVRDPATIDNWVSNIDYYKVYPLLAEVEGLIVGDATLHMDKVGWKRHLGNIRVVVAQDYKYRGLGTLLINEIVELAGEFGLEKLIVEIHLQALATLAAFKKAGFSAKAVFEDLVKDPAGKSSDLVVMVCDVQAGITDRLPKQRGLSESLQQATIDYYYRCGA
jgi:L-amino acid N-acyltransferase YncA